jgi:hypothetical protein
VSDTPPGISAVLRELDAIHRTIHENRELVKMELDEHRSVVRSEMDARFSVITEKQDEQLAEAKKTNGRVTRLEMWRYGLEAVAAARSWVKPALIGVATGAFLTVLGYLLSLTT